MKIKDRVSIWMAVLAVAAVVSTLAGGWIRAGGLALTAVACARLSAIARKKALRFINGPYRFCGGKGIEIGSGGRPFLKSSLLVDIVDDFSAERPYRVDHLADAHHLPMFETGSLDYVVASHVLEHMADPLKALIEWVRILKTGGVLWLRIPDKRKTFDRARERTPLGHLIDDYARGVPPDDRTHEEDNNRNTIPPRNVTHPYIHHHVWIPEDVVEIFVYLSSRTPLEIVACRENSCRNAEDFWVVVRKG